MPLFYVNLPETPHTRRLTADSNKIAERRSGPYVSERSTLGRPRRHTRRWRREQRGALANPEKSGGAKLRDWDADLTARQEALCSPDCNWQNRGNPVTQRLDLPRGKLRNGSPPAGSFASDLAKKGR